MFIFYSFVVRFMKIFLWIISCVLNENETRKNPPSICPLGVFFFLFLKTRLPTDRPTDWLTRFIIDLSTLFFLYIHPFCQHPWKRRTQQSRQFPPVSIMTDIISPTKAQRQRESRSSSSSSFQSFATSFLWIIFFLWGRRLSSRRTTHVSQVKVTGHKFTRPGRYRALPATGTRQRINTFT